ncbi:hypothetical protein JAAARDRAFT_211889 [Jaapia argillacea MUCL 33604]|uniref:Uncharacterized protein n=1 Tax=Jaapia argillacea MUCL 33604 TaxID=933084 RepID=A0A067PI27_9AGAM|nr:hypothetical protein JAAARDRAFT_211889 [Jaapia argillacea MUCL 33604]
MNGAIHVLPNELLGQIFIYSESPFVVRRCAGISLSHVARHWRSVACSIPQLWMNIVIFLLRGSHSLEEEMEMVSTYLTRSKNSPLNIRISRYSPNFDDEIEEPREIASLYSLLVPHVDRFRSLSLRISDRDFRLTLTDLVQNIGAPSLQYLHISALIDSRIPDPPEELSFPLFHPAPKLTHLRVSGNFTTSTSALSLRHIAVLDVGNQHTLSMCLQSHTFFEMLRCCPVLTKLIIRGGVSLLPQKPPFTLPSLRIMVIASPFIPIPPFFCALLMPNLDTLEFVDMHWNTLKIILLPLLLSSKVVLPNLTTLTLTFIGGITGSDSGFFRVFPTIKNLKLIHNHYGVHDTALSTFAEPYSSPQFTTLTLAPIGNYLDTAPVFRFLRSRVASGHPISKVRLSRGCRASLTSDKIAALLQMVDIEEFEVGDEVELPLSDGTRNLEWWE